jgi:hypothetical protein
VFVEPDFYTVKVKDGKRELIFEDTLSTIESAYASIVENKVNRRADLSDTERFNLCVFTAAMSARTTAQKENFSETFGKIHEMVLSLEKQHGLPPIKSKETERVRDHAVQTVMASILPSMPPILFKMSFAIIITDEDNPFITSDHPCVWFNPQMHKLPPFYRHPGLGHKDIEVRLPLTPTALAIFSWQEAIQGYQSFKMPSGVDEINRTTRAYSHEDFITNNGEIKTSWLEPGEMPPDAWERTHPSPSGEIPPAPKTSED